MEAVEAVVDANQVDAIRERLRLHLGLRLAERLETDGAAATERVVVLAEALAQIFVHFIEQAVDLVDFFLLSSFISRHRLKIRIIANVIALFCFLAISSASPYTDFP